LRVVASRCVVSSKPAFFMGLQASCPPAFCCEILFASLHRLASGTRCFALLLVGVLSVLTGASSVPVALVVSVVGADRSGNTSRAAVSSPAYLWV